MLIDPRYPDRRTNRPAIKELKHGPTGINPNANFLKMTEWKLSSIPLLQGEFLKRQQEQSCSQLDEASDMSVRRSGSPSSTMSIGHVNHTASKQSLGL